MLPGSQVADYIGHHHLPAGPTPPEEQQQGPFSLSLPQREADLLPLRLRAQGAPSQAARQAAKVGLWWGRVEAGWSCFSTVPTRV